MFRYFIGAVYYKGVDFVSPSFGHDCGTQNLMEVEGRVDKALFYKAKHPFRYGFRTNTEDGSFKFNILIERFFNCLLVFDNYLRNKLVNVSIEFGHSGEVTRFVNRQTVQVHPQ